MKKLAFHRRGCITPREITPIRSTPDAVVHGGKINKFLRKENRKANVNSGGSST